MYFYSNTDEVGLLTYAISYFQKIYKCCWCTFLTIVCRHFTKYLELEVAVRAVMPQLSHQVSLKDWFGENKIFFQRVLLNSPSKNKPNDIIHLTE